MLNKVILYTSICILSCSCSLFNTPKTHQEPTDLLFQNKDIKSIKVQVERDNKLCKNDTNNNQTCPIKLYINDFKSGVFFINNKASYYLKPSEYIFKVKNCTNDCANNELKIDLKNELNNVKYILSIDNESNPIIIKK